MVEFSLKLADLVLGGSILGAGVNLGHNAVFLDAFSILQHVIQHTAGI